MPSVPAGGQAYIPLPDDAYQLSGLEVTIPKGTLQAAIPITVFPDKLSSTEKYMLAFRIKETQGYAIASNYKTMLFTMVVQ